MENITVCIRIRPTGNKEEESIWKIERNSIQSTKTKEIFNYDETNENLFISIMKDPIESFLNGINLSVFAYGQTCTGKTYTMRGSSNNLNGMIPLSIKEITNRLAEEESQSNGNFKYILKASYLELYNETVNDLLDGSKKNLEIRESLQKGVFVNGMTEIPINTYEKAMQLLKQGENLRVIAETKLNEKSSRSHVIFRLTLEITRLIDDNEKTLFSQLNLIDLAGSENVIKAKTDGIRMKEGTNINKSLLALSNVIQKLSSNPKSFVNYRDSKLTRLLQPVLSGNSKTTIICTISDAVAFHSETLNTLHFGAKAKTIKTIIKVNEMLDEKNKIILENTQLKTKIKQLEEMIIEKKNISEEENLNLNSNGINTDFIENKSNLNPILEKSHIESISTLEKEVALLKKILITNEEIGDADANSTSNEILSTNSNNINQASNNTFDRNSINTNSNILSANKFIINKHNQTSNSMMMSSGKKMTDSARKIYRRDENLIGYNNFNEPEYNVPLTSNTIFRRCMTDMKMNSFAPSIFSNTNSTNTNINNYLLNSQSKNKFITSTTGISNFIPSSAYKNNNSSNGSSFNNNYISNPNFESDFDVLCRSNDNSLHLLKENDELRKNLYELRKNYLETVQNKENQIKYLNYNLSITNDNCEKIIKEAEENYFNLKLSFDRTREDLLNKDTEIKNLNQLIRNSEINANYYNEEINRLNVEIDKFNDALKDDNIYRDLELRFKEVSKNFESLNKSYDNDKNLLNELKNQNEKFRNESSSCRMLLENYKSENLSFKTQYDIVKRNYDILSIENSNLKNNIESYKNEVLSTKDKINKMKNELNQLNKSKEATNVISLMSDKEDKKNSNNTSSHANSGTKSNFIIDKYEELVIKFENQISFISQKNLTSDDKKDLRKNDQSQITDYQKLLEESFAKMLELQNELENSLQKNIYLEKVLKLGHEQASRLEFYTNTDKKFLSSNKNVTPLKERKNFSNIKRDINFNPNANYNDLNKITHFSLKENDPFCLNLKDEDKLESLHILSPGQDFIGKKRKHLTKMFQNIIDKNLITGVREETLKNKMNQDKENIKDL